MIIQASTWATFLQLANFHVVQVGWVWDEGGPVNVCIKFMDSP